MLKLADEAMSMETWVLENNVQKQKVPPILEIRDPLQVWDLLELMIN